MIAIPVRAENTEGIIRKMKEAEKLADILEIWVEKGINFKKIIKNAKKPLIFINKIPEEGGNFRGTEEERVEMLIHAIENGASYIDIGIDTNKKFIQKLVKTAGNCRIIISYHNFTEMPDLRELERIAETAKNLGADIIKIAVTPKNIKESFTFLDLAKKFKKSGEKFIIIGMGKFGVHTRIFAPLIGSYLTYAAINEKEKTAPGQITAKEFRKIWKILYPGGVP